MKRININPKEALEFQISHNTPRIKKTNSKAKSKTRKSHILTIREHAPKAVSVLCIGCRSASELEDFRAQGFVPTGIDILPSTDYIVIDAHEIEKKFKENQFDIVYASHSLEHLYDPDQVLRGIRKVSRMGVFMVLPAWSPQTPKYDVHTTPTISHPVIYDVMTKNEISNTDLRDFRPLEPCKIMHYKKIDRDKFGAIDECELFLLWKATKKPININPKSVILYLTKRCDSRCPYCTWILKDPDFFHTRADLDMPLSSEETKKTANTDLHLPQYTGVNAKSIVDYYHSIGVRKIRLQAEGEVLLYANLRELTEYCKSKGFSGFDFPTNAIKLDKYIDFVLENLDSISISIDGYDAPTFIVQRGGTEATFDKVIANTRKLVKSKKKSKSKTRILVNCVIHSKDYKNKVLPMIDLAEDLGVDVIRFSNFHAIEGGGGLKPLTAKDILHLQQMVRRAKKHEVLVKLPSIDNRKLIESNNSKFYCSMLFNKTVIGSEGNYSPCCRIDSDPKWGNVRDDPKHNSKSLQILRESFITANHVEELAHPYCQNCTRLKRG